MKCTYKNTNGWQCLVCFILDCQCYVIDFIKLFHNWDRAQQEELTPIDKFINHKTSKIDESEGEEI